MEEKDDIVDDILKPISIKKFNRIGIGLSRNIGSRMLLHCSVKRELARMRLYTDASTEWNKILEEDVEE